MTNVGRNAFGLLVASCCVGFLWAAEKEAKPDLSGHWVLNKQKSDDPGKKIMEAMASRRGMGGGGVGGRGMGGRGGGRGGAGGGSAGGQGSEGSDRPGAMANEPPLDGAPALADARPDADAASGRRRPRGPIPSPKLEVAQDGEQITLRTESHERVIVADAKSHDKAEPFPMNVTARFKKDALEVESKAQRGPGRLERYSVKDGQLVIEFEAQGMGARPGYKFRLVYDREAAS